jgi:epoxyqueuosine reductase
MIRDRRSDVSDLTRCIREGACRLGFFKTGIAAAHPLPHPERFTSWLKEGLHADMRYMERQASKRLDPGMVLGGARSIIVPAMHYHTDDAPTNEGLKGKISRYAWGTDYHLTVMNRLEQLLGYIRDLDPSAQGRCYVDTGPIMEKVWGAETALGWMGKHTNLITRERGSWFFIGVILLNLELEYDAPERNYCGECSQCITACPTGAITAPYILDARRCISYLTIELRGPIPVGLRPLIGNRIFGCDDCQEVCPWNRFAAGPSERGFAPRREPRMPDLLPLVHITGEEFSARYAGSPILRATRDGFVRNVVVALGNSGSDEAVPALKEALLDSSLLVREHARWALKQIRNDE